MAGKDLKSRCSWATTPLMIRYHDTEWGVPAHDDRILFEFLLLEGAQAGLSWETILSKREHYRKAFAGFDPARVARFSPVRVDRLMANPGLVRNRLKIDSAVSNAKAFLQVQREFGSFDAFLWKRVGGAAVLNRWRRPADVPATTSLSDELSADLRRRGFKFVGSTICYAFLQAVGVVNDHLLDCPARLAPRDVRGAAPERPSVANESRHVAFLRGINLGRRRVEMSTLRSLFAELGLTDVSTFIASGNVLFTGAGAGSELAQRIGRHLGTRLGYEVETFVRSGDEVDRVARAQPFPSCDLAGPHGLHVIFLREPLARSTAVRLQACRTDVDAFRVDGREIYWRSPPQMSQSAIWNSPAVKSLRLPEGTMRNMNTVRRIADLLRSGR